MSVAKPDRADIPDLEDRPFLHEQGQYVCRGFVSALIINDENWALEIRDIEALNKSNGTWQFDGEADEYGGAITSGTIEIMTDGFICIHGYAMEIHIAPLTQDPWLNIDWPELDAYAGGPMDTSGLTKRQLKKLKRKFR